MIACPYCAEQIQEAAIKCRWCGSDLTVPTGRFAAHPGAVPGAAGPAAGPAPPVPGPPAWSLTGPQPMVPPGSPVGPFTGPQPMAPPVAPHSAPPMPHAAQHTAGYGPPPGAAFANRPVQAMSAFLNSFTSPGALARYWRGPLLSGVSAFGGAILSCVLIFGAIYAFTVAEAPRADTIPNPIQIVLLLFFQFHRVAITAEVDGYEEMTATFVFAPLGGLLLVGVLLAIGGAFAGRQEQTFGGRAMAVVRYAAVYAILCFFASFFVGGRLANAGDAARGQLTASPLGAFFMGLLLASAFGLVGAATRAYGRRWVRPAGMAIERRVRGGGGAFVGAVSGLRTGLGLALLGIIVMIAISIVVAAVNAPPGTGSTTSDAGDSSSSGDGVGILLLGLLTIVLVLPNLVIATLLAGMGATLNAAASALTGQSFSGSVGIFGASGTGSESVDVPAYFLLLLLVPATATVRAGYVAARSTAPGTGPAMRAALGAGGLMAIGCWFLAWLCGGEASTPVGQASISVSPVATLFLPPVWALGGAWLGALLHLARQQQLQQRPEQAGAYAVPNGHYQTAPGQYATSGPWTAATPPPYGDPANAWPTSAPPAYPAAPCPAPASGPPAYPAQASRPPAYPAPASRPPAYPAPASWPPAYPAPASVPPAGDASRPCAHCGAPNQQTNNFCEACGRHLASAA